MTRIYLLFSLEELGKVPVIHDPFIICHDFSFISRRLSSQPLHPFALPSLCAFESFSPFAEKMGHKQIKQNLK